MLASKNNHRQANFAHGFLLHEGNSNNSFTLLILALLSQYGFNFGTIKKELKKRTDLTVSSIEKILREIYVSKYIHQNISKHAVYALYEYYRYKDYLYNIGLNPIESSELEHINEKAVPPKYPNAKDLTSEFYRGLGEEFYSSS
ncbi:hypothetical protein M9Y10_007429 [Tritrichomonas musculus]|uniref:Uncharacterized protein n=1 Tax=Tritrichomonas musculus TaxID=1915356 RepID=A0ABR2J3P7_9EUKA